MIFDTSTNEIYYLDGVNISNIQQLSNGVKIEDFVKSIYPDDREQFLDSLYDCVSGKSQDFNSINRIARESGSSKYEWWETRGIMAERFELFGIK